MLHNILAEGHFKNVTVSFLRPLYHSGVIQFKSKHSSISCAVQECLSLQTYINLTDWPPQAPDLNPIENMMCDIKKTV
jgi:hypothetical protein